MLAMRIAIVAMNTANETAASAAPDLDRYRARSRSASREASGARQASRASLSTMNGASRAAAISQASIPAMTRYPAPWPPPAPPEKNRMNRPTARKMRPGRSERLTSCGGSILPERAATTGILLTARPGQTAAMTEVATASSRPMTTAAQGRLKGSVRCAVAVSRCG